MSKKLDSGKVICKVTFIINNLHDSYTLEKSQKIDTGLDGVPTLLANENGEVYCGEVQLSTSTTKIGDYDVEVEILHIPPPPRKPHIPRKFCCDCFLFSRARGISQLNEVTHKFANEQEGRMWKEIVDITADNMGLPSLSNDNVGWCSVNQALTSEDAPSCESFKERPSRRKDVK